MARKVDGVSRDLARGTKAGPLQPQAVEGTPRVEETWCPRAPTFQIYGLKVESSGTTITKVFGVRASKSGGL